MTDKTAGVRPQFSVEEMQAANTRPTIEIEGYVYEGELFSAVDWFLWNERIQVLKKQVEGGHATHYDLLQFYHQFFRAVFPAGLWGLGLFRRGVPAWAPDVADTLLREPMSTIEEAFECFFGRQAQANGVEIPTATRPPMTHGNGSSDKTHDTPVPEGAA